MKTISLIDVMSEYQYDYNLYIMKVRTLLTKLNNYELYLNEHDEDSTTQICD